MKIAFSEQAGKSKHIIYPILKGQEFSTMLPTLAGFSRKIEFEGKFGSSLDLHHPKLDSIVYLLGLGQEKDQAKAEQTFRKLAYKHKAEWKEEVEIVLGHVSEYYLPAAVYGVAMASYVLGTYKNVEEEFDAAPQELTLTLVLPENKKLRQLSEEALIMAETQMRIMRLVDAPANIKHPEYLARWAADSAKQYQYKVDILYKHDLQNEGLQAVLAVGQGSKHPPVMIKAEYYPEHLKHVRPKLGLVGKGVTFDTGGISIKPSTNMHYMKSDMGGAAAVLGTMELAARLKLDIHLVALIPCAENSVDAQSMLPGDVIQSYSGKSIEIIDTDAEGRLILADALAYMKRNYFPEVMIDLATLTGSSVRTLGYAAGALFANNDDLSKQLQDAGHLSNERLWPLPLWEDYDEDIQSDVADVKNFSGKPVAGAISAAKFLEAFIDDHPQWAHLDIAGVAFGSTIYSKTKSATGYGIRLLHQYLQTLIANS